MGGRKLAYTRAVVICHGKSEKMICQYIAQNLRLSIISDADKNGDKSIEIEGLMNHLNNTVYKSMKSFIKKYDKVNVKGKGNSMEIMDFKIFIIMDKDNCNDEIFKSYVDKSMFKNHWAYKYIVPIYNIKNLEDIISKCNINYEYTDSKVKNYIRIFPINSNKKDAIQLKEFRDNLEKINDTNMCKFVDYCLCIKLEDKNRVSAMKIR